MTTEIDQLVTGWIEALRARDVNARTGHYAPDVMLFDVVNPLRHTGLEALIDGEWTVTHEHASVPFDPATGQASTDLKP